MRAELLLFLLFAIMIVFSKFAGHISRRYLHQPIVFGEILISRGEVGLIVVQIGLVAGAITADIYAAVIIMVLATTIVTPVLLRFFFPPPAPAPEVTVYESVTEVEWSQEGEDF